MIGPILTRKKRCPHAAMHLCPLYVASHVGDGLGCHGLDHLNCDVDLGLLSYADETMKVYAAHPAILQTHPPAITGRAN